MILMILILNWSTFKGERVFYKTLQNTITTQEYLVIPMIFHPLNASDHQDDLVKKKHEKLLSSVNLVGPKQFEDLREG